MLYVLEFPGSCSAGACVSPMEALNGRSIMGEEECFMGGVCEICGARSQNETRKSETASEVQHIEQPINGSCVGTRMLASASCRVNRHLFLTELQCRMSMSMKVHDHRSYASALRKEGLRVGLMG